MFTAALILATLITGAISSTMATNAKLKASERARSQVIQQLSQAQTALESTQTLKTKSDSQLKQKATTEAQLRAHIKNLVRKLQSKRAAQVASGFGGNSGSTPTYVPGVYAGLGRAPFGFGNSYEPGQCVWGVANWKRVPIGMHNANQWDDYARAWGWTVSSTPRVGAVAETDAGYYGHVALVIAISGGQTEVREMNYQGPFITDERWTPVSAWQYIYF